MTVRGIYTSLLFFPETYPLPTPPIATYQNYSPDPVIQSVDGVNYNFTYLPFTASSVIVDSNSVTNDVSVTFAATGAIIDFLETAILNRYEVWVSASVWGSTIDVPDTTAASIYSFITGYIQDAETDFATMTIRVGQYDNGSTADFPWRRIPWTILGPLSVRN